jgi:hypothetical protein
MMHRRHSAYEKCAERHFERAPRALAFAPNQNRAK